MNSKTFGFPTIRYFAGKTYLKSLFQRFDLENSLCKKSKTVDFAKRSNLICLLKKKHGKKSKFLKFKAGHWISGFCGDKKRQRKHKQEKNLEWKHKKEISEKLNRIKKEN